MKNVYRALCFCAACALNAFTAVVLPVSVTIDGYVYTDPYPMKIASKPIAGVKAYLESQLTILNQATGVSIPVVLVDSAITDASGHFAFKPATPETYNISFQAPGYATLTESLDPTKDTTIHVSMLVIGAHGSVTGKVYSGCTQSSLLVPCILTPLPKCTVTVSVGLLSSLLAKRSAVIYPPIAAQVFTAVTNDSGNYSIDSIPISSNNTRATVTAAKGGFVSQSVDTGLWNMTKTTVNFTLSPNQGQAGGDSVYTTPANPTTKDSITYNFYDSDACCCAQFANPVVVVQDTDVILSFSVNSAPCQTCACMGNGKWYAFKGGRLSAGRYGIYRQEGIYCPPPLACLAIIALPVKIGEVVVAGTAVSHPLPAVPQAGRLVLRQEKNTVTMNVSLVRPSHLRLNVFNAQGMLIGQIYNGEANAGNPGFSWKAASLGIYVLSVEINGVPAYSRKILILH